MLHTAPTLQHACLQIDKRTNAVERLRSSLGLSTMEAKEIQQRLVLASETDAGPDAPEKKHREVHITTSLGQTIDFSEEYEIEEGVLLLDTHEEQLDSVTCTWHQVGSHFWKRVIPRSTG